MSIWLKGMLADVMSCDVTRAMSHAVPGEFFENGLVPWHHNPFEITHLRKSWTHFWLMSIHLCVKCPHDPHFVYH